jgi:protein-L-isoaspartate O-methyltransferase
MLHISFLFALVASTQSAGTREPVRAAPYVPSPQLVVTEMLKLANVGPSDFVIDLGSGDGRIVLTAAKQFGARGLGVEIQEDLLKASNESARTQGLADRVRFVKQDLFKANVAPATVVTMYLIPETVEKLRDKLLAELRPGARIVSHDYTFAGWTSDKQLDMNLDEKVAVTGVTRTLISLYIVPAKVAGRWTAKLPPSVVNGPAELEFRQEFSSVSGVARLPGRELALDQVKLSGEKLRFALALDGVKPTVFEGQVKGPTIQGVVAAAGSKLAWSASLAGKS